MMLDDFRIIVWCVFGNPKKDRKVLWSLFYQDLTCLFFWGTISIFQPQKVLRMHFGTPLCSVENWMDLTWLHQGNDRHNQSHPSIPRTGSHGIVHNSWPGHNCGSQLFFCFFRVCLQAGPCPGFENWRFQSWIEHGHGPSQVCVPPNSPIPREVQKWNCFGGCPNSLVDVIICSIRNCDGSPISGVSTIGIFDQPSVVSSPYASPLDDVGRWPMFMTFPSFAWFCRRYNTYLRTIRRDNARQRVCQPFWTSPQLFKQQLNGRWLMKLALEDDTTATPWRKALVLGVKCYCVNLQYLEDPFLVKP